MSILVHLLCNPNDLILQVYLNSDIAEVLTGDLPPDAASSVEQEKSPPSSRRVSFGSESHSSVGYNQDILNTYRELLLCGKTQV